MGDDGLVRLSLRRAVGGGLDGALAMVLQVLALMWLRTTVNFQQSTGASWRASLTALYAEGGVGRFYQGLGAALLQGPLCRFGDTAAQSGMMLLLADVHAMPEWLKTACASLLAAAWRVAIMPVDALKMALQVRGRRGLRELRAKVTRHGPTALYEGAVGAAVATFAGHWPWFVTFQYLDRRLPGGRGGGRDGASGGAADGGSVSKACFSGAEEGDVAAGAPRAEPSSKANTVSESVAGDLATGSSSSSRSSGGGLFRHALIGFCASVSSDCVSNGVRVVKSVKQTSPTLTSYTQAARMVLAKDGVSGLLARGLGLKLFSNGLSAMLFTVAWRSLGERKGGGQQQQQQQQQDKLTERQLRQRQ